MLGTTMPRLACGFTLLRPALPGPANPHADGSQDVVVRPERADWSNLVADLSIASPGLCRGLFELYLGSSSGAPGWGQVSETALPGTLLQLSLLMHAGCVL